jgi:hypothetical protein
MSEKKSLTNLTITSFWHREGGKIMPLYNTVGIDRIVEAEGEQNTTIVHFAIRPSGLEFLEHIREGFVSIRYDAIPLDSPHAGGSFMTLREIDPFEIVIETLNPVEMPASEVVFKVKAGCVLTWDIISSPIASRRV